MFDYNKNDLDLIAMDLHERSNLPLDQCYEEAEIALAESGEVMRNALLQAIGAVSYEPEFIDEALVIDPKIEEEERKDISEMTLDELWPHEEELQAYMRAVSQASFTPPAEMAIQNLFAKFLDEWIDMISDDIDLDDTLDETMDKLGWFVDHLENHLVNCEREWAEYVARRVAIEARSLQTEYDLACTTHCAGASRDLAIECMEKNEDDIRRDWHHSNPDFWEWAEKFDETPSRRFHLHIPNFDHLVENRDETISLFIRVYDVLDYYHDMSRWLQQEIMKAKDDRNRLIKLIDAKRSINKEVENIRQGINALRYGIKLDKEALSDIKNLPRDWNSFNNHKFKAIPFPRLDAKSWVILMNKINAVLGVRKLYEIKAA